MKRWIAIGGAGAVGLLVVALAMAVGMGPPGGTVVRATGTAAVVEDPVRAPSPVATQDVAARAVEQETARPAAAVKPPHDWRQGDTWVASELGVQLSVLGVTVSTTAGAGETTRPVPPTPPLPDLPAELKYLVAFVAFTAPGADSSAFITPDLARMAAVDSLSGQYPVAYVELARRPGLTLGAVTFRGAQQRAKTFSLRAESVRVGPDGGVTETRLGPWEVPLAVQLMDRPPGGSNTTMQGPAVQTGEMTVRPTCCAWLPTGQSWAFAIERPGASPEHAYAAVDGASGAVGTLGAAAGACLFHWLHPRPGPSFASAPAGASCAALAATTPAPTPSAAAPRMPTPPAALTAAAQPPPPPRTSATPYPTPAGLTTPAFSRQRALDAVREQPQGGGRVAFRRVDRKEAKLTTRGEWEQVVEGGIEVVGRDVAAPIWVVVVRGEVVVSSLVGINVSSWGGVLLDPATGAPLGTFARPDGEWRRAWERLPDRDPARCVPAGGC